MGGGRSRHRCYFLGPGLRRFNKKNTLNESFTTSLPLFLIGHFNSFFSSLSFLFENPSDQFQLGVRVKGCATGTQAVEAGGTRAQGQTQSYSKSEVSLGYVKLLTKIR